MLPDVNVVAFALERNGAWGDEAATFIQKVGMTFPGTEDEKAQDVWRLVARISVALQRGNARFLEITAKRLAVETGSAWSPVAAA